MLCCRSRSAASFSFIFFNHLQLWLEEDVELYDFAKVRPFIKKKQVKVRQSLPSLVFVYSHVLSDFCVICGFQTHDIVTWTV